MQQLEYFFLCPYCGAEISMLLDPTIARQEYIEDCEVCCNPISLRLAFEDHEVVIFDAQSIEQ